MGTAEVQAGTLVAFIKDRLVTRQDFEVRIMALETKVERDLKDFELRLLIRLGCLSAVAVGVMVTLVKVL